MDLLSIPRAAVGAGLKVARLPLDVALKLAGRGKDAELVVDRADAAARDLAGAALGDEQLRRDATRRRTAADTREEAYDLHAEAAERSRAAARQREQAERRAAEKRDAAEDARNARTRAAANTAERRKAANERAAQATEDALDTKAKRDRLEQLDRATDALEQRDAALTASDEAARLRDEAERAKAARKS